MYWCGEVVEVDETGGRIFVCMTNPDQKPTTGTFYVRPFEFLALLYEVFNVDVFSKIREVLLLAWRDGGWRLPRLSGPVSQGLPTLSPCGTMPGVSSGDRQARARPTASASRSPDP